MKNDTVTIQTTIENETSQSDRTLALVELARRGNSDAKDLIVRENSGLIWSVVRKFMNRGHEAEDLFQIGAIGLIKCIDKFDTSYQVKFSTYAVPMIMGEIKRFIRDDGMIKVSRPLKEMAAKVHYMREQMTHSNGKEPTVSEIAVALDASVEELVLAVDACREVESLYSTASRGDGSGTPVYLIDKLGRTGANQTDDANTLVDVIALKQIINQLDPKSRKVIIMRYFKEKTQAETAAVLGVSQVQVSRIEKKVLKILKEKLTEL